MTEQPWFSHGCPTNHDPVHSETVKGLLCFHRIGNIPITNDGNMHSGIVLHLSDEGPVGCSLIHLCPGSTMDGKRTDSLVLQLFGHLHDHLIAARPIPTWFLQLQELVETSTMALVISIIRGILASMPAPAPRLAIFLTGQP